jgi:hypothetical protein
LRLAAEEAVAFFLALAEIRTPRELARARLVRVALAGLCFIIGAGGLLAYCSSLMAIAPR